MVTPATPTRIKSARRPRLRLVPSSLTTTPHAVWFQLSAGCYRIECWTESEWDAMAPAERPPDEERVHLPGIGWITAVRIGKEEQDDLTDVVGRSWAAYNARRGIERE